MAEYRQMSIYFDMEKSDEAWAYQYLMSLRHGKKAMVITALKMMLGKGEQAVLFPIQTMQPPKAVGTSEKKKIDRRKAFGHPAQESYLEGESVGDGKKGEPGMEPNHWKYLCRGTEKFQHRKMEKQYPIGAPFLHKSSLRPFWKRSWTCPS